MEYEIIFQEKLADHELQILWDGIESDAQSKVGATGRHELAYLLRNAEGSIIGGVQGNYDNFGWLWIDSLWVSDKIRGSGFGVQLLDQIEREAIKNGCAHAHLTSFTYQAVEFYKKQGYTVFGELEDYLVGHSRCWLRKKLV